MFRVHVCMYACKMKNVLCWANTAHMFNLSCTVCLTDTKKLENFKTQSRNQYLLDLCLLYNNNQISINRISVNDLRIKSE